MERENELVTVRCLEEEAEAEAEAEVAMKVAYWSLRVFGRDIFKFFFFWLNFCGTQFEFSLIILVEMRERVSPGLQTGRILEDGNRFRIHFVGILRFLHFNYSSLIVR